MYKPNKHFVIYDWGNNIMIARFGDFKDAYEHLKTCKSYNTWILYQEIHSSKEDNDMAGPMMTAFGI